MPQSAGLDQSLCDLIGTWIGSRLGYGKVSNAAAASNEFEVRLVVVDGNRRDSAVACDAVLIVVPPPWSDEEGFAERNENESLESLASRIDPEIPRVVLVLENQVKPNFLIKDTNLIIAKLFAGAFNTLYIQRE